MARLTREQLKLFGNSGSTSYFGEFGSKAAGSPVTTKVLDTIQALGAWDTGLQDACVTALDGSKAPFLEDINSLMYVHSYQQSYLFQEGIPEWEATVSYYKGSIAKKINATAGAVELYCSLSDANLNHALPTLVNDSYWAFLVLLKAGDIAIAAGKIFYLDGGGDTYIKENSTPNIIDVYAGAGLSAQFLATGLAIPTTQKLYFDGGGDSYLYEKSANLLELTVGSVVIAQVSTSIFGLEANADLSIKSTKKFYLDGGGDTYIVEGSANTIRFYYGGSFAQLNANGFSIPATQGIYLDGGSDTYLTEISTNHIAVYAGGNHTVSVTTNGLQVENTYNLKLVGVGTQIIVAGTNRLEFWQSTNFNFHFDNGGAGYADYSWSTFSPDIKKHDVYKNKSNLIPRDYLDWALEDAKKPIKPYKGLPVIKSSTSPLVLEDNNVFDTQEEIDQEHKKYAKDICKIAMGVAYWAEEAEQRLLDLESKVNKNN
jgi:hypothetical protein